MPGKHWKRWRPSRCRGRGLVAAAAAVAAAGSLLYAAPSSGLPKPTPPKEKITQGQVDAAAGARADLASQVGELSGEVAAAKVQLQHLQDQAELAEQKYALAYSQYLLARKAAHAAQRAVQAAQARMEAAHAGFVQYVQAMYMTGGVDGTTASLLTADDPSALLEQSTLEDYQRQHRADAVGALDAATVAKSNADAKARLAVIAANKAKARADHERQAAQAAYLAAEQQKAALEQTMAAKQTELSAKQDELAQLTYGRRQWLDYVTAKHAYDVWLAAKIAREQARQRRLAREQARERRLAQERAWQAAHQHHPSGGSGGGSSSGSGGGSSSSSGGGSRGGSSGWHPGPTAPSGGGWTAGKGRAAADRALSELGMPYAWAGGGAYGPSRGVCAGGAAWNDCNITGFDCSGLAMYAWGGGWWAHYAASQFIQAGRFHPGVGNLMPGDLIFWSSNGAISGIHHVAIYIGGGQMIEAPYSGGYVQIASIWEYGGFFGATRPLS